MDKRLKVLFLFANNSVRSGKADPQALKDLMTAAAGQLNVDMDIFVSYARSLSFLISNKKVKIRDNRNHMDLDEYDFVYFRKAGSAMQQMLTCALYLKDNNIPFYDTELAKSNSRNKLSQMYMLQRKSVPIPKTLFCRNNRRLIRLVGSRYAKDFAFPLIAKATGGTRGDANYLVKSIEELENIIKTEKRHFMIQEFIPNDGDMRFFIVNGALKGVIGRKASGDSHLNNTSKGGSADLLNRNDFSDVVVADALESALVFGRDCAGVDVIFNKDTGAHYILEVNRAPQIEHASFENEKAIWMVEAILSSIMNNHLVAKKGKDKGIIGRFEAVKLLDQESNVIGKVIAKVDTGADSSSIHADKIKVVDGVLTCEIAGKIMSFDNFFDKKVKSSNGVLQHRYMIELVIQIGKVSYNMKVTLNDRSNMNYSMLIGRRFLKSYGLKVDVGRRYVASGKDK